MSNSKISALTSATTPLAGTETLPIVQSSATKQVSVANLTAGRTQTSNGIVQGTAATGYNFTANTPSAGMTSQLLNWYEEGTYTATITAGSGAFTSVTQSLFYTRTGRIMQVAGRITIVINGTAGTYLGFTLPIASAANDVSFAGRENQVIGLVFGGASISTTTIAITKYDGTYLGGNSYVFPIQFSYKLG